MNATATNRWALMLLMIAVGHSPARALALTRAVLAERILAQGGFWPGVTGGAIVMLFGDVVILSAF